MCIRSHRFGEKIKKVAFRNESFRIKLLVIDRGKDKNIEKLLDFGSELGIDSKKENIKVYFIYLGGIFISHIPLLSKKTTNFTKVLKLI
jgi:hypothetical protein